MGSKTDLKQTFTTFLKQQNLEGAKLLLMVSGGVDSMVLLHVAQQVVAPNLLTALHINHNARDEAEDDANFVQNYCSKNNIQCVLKSLPTAGYLPEDQWRAQRQTLSTETMTETGAERILTAHHATDLAETMIFRLAKGAGPSGLSPFDVSTKPFWQVPKTDLVAYAQQHHLEWREDASNQDVRFERNRIRHEVIPTLREITPNLEAVMVKESQVFAETQDFLLTQLGLAISAAQTSSTSLPLEAFLSLHPILQKEWLRSVAVSTPSQAELNDCLKWLLGEPEGHSQKNVGGTNLMIVRGEIVWG